MYNRTKLFIGVMIAVLTLTILPAAAFAQEGPTPPRSFQRSLMHTLLDAASQSLGMDAKDLIQSLREGKTPAELAQEAGVSPEDLAAAMQSAWNAEGERLISGFIENGLPRGRVGVKRFGRGHRGMQKLREIRLWTKASAEALDMPMKAFVQALREGRTPEQIAETHGSSGQALIDAIVAATKVRLDQSVAAGKLTQERADRTLARTAEKAAHWVQNGVKRPNRNRTSASPSR